MPPKSLAALIQRRRQPSGGMEATKTIDAAPAASIMPRRRTWLRRSLLGAAVLTAPAIGLAGALGWYFHTLPSADLDKVRQVSTTVVDRNGELLRAFTTTEGRWRLPLEVSQVDQRYLRMLIAYEDRRFYAHRGIDPLAVLRAGGLLVRHGKMLSGASTLTMQTARLIDSVHERTALGKIRQMARALQLERQMSKTTILGHYLRLAPFGGNIEGVRAASLAYFGKEPRRLSVGEAALLVAIPQSPSYRRPDRSPETARRARDRVIDKVLAAKVITADEARAAKAERMPATKAEFPKLAPHLAEQLTSAAPITQVHRTTLDRPLQAALEPLARDHAHQTGQRLSAAVVVADHATGDILAYVGAADYFDEDRNGAVDMARAVRSPGSTLKPIIYGLAFEAGIAHPETLIEDRSERFGTYVPKNFDLEFHGTVTVREALALSLNIPAVKMLASVGPGKLANRLRRAGAPPVLPRDAEPTLAMALGGVGLRLVDLATLYAAMARGGDPVALRHLMPINPPEPPRPGDGRPQRLLSPIASWQVTDILKDAPPPTNARGGRIAYKTGTSYGYRDAWAVGYDGKHVVAVWIGRPDGAAIPGLVGRSAAAPLLFDAFARISVKRAPLPGAPAGTLRVSGADLPPPLKRFREASEVASGPASPFIDTPVMISFPPDRAEVALESDGADAVVLKAEGGALPLTWLVDDQPLASAPHRREAAWHPDSHGFARITVVDAKGRVDRVTIRLR